MQPPRTLVVNADDFGQSPGVNRGVVEAHRRGIVTSASLMVRWPAAREAAVLAADCPALSVGLHLDLGEWRLEDDGWKPLYQVVALDDEPAVTAEIASQVAAFTNLVGRPPTHLDSHQHVHLREPALTAARARAAELGVPLRRHGRAQYCGAFYGQDADGSTCHERITVEALIALLEALPPGVTELCCHPAVGSDLDTMYSAEREQELRVLCDPRVREAIGRLGIELRSFRDVAP